MVDEINLRPLRVMLIQPPNIAGVRPLICHMDEKNESVGFKPPLGLLSIGTYLKNKTAHNLFVLDAWAEKMDLEQCLKKVIAYQPEIIGISAWTDWWYAAARLGELIKESIPGAHICYGGPHVAIYPKETLSFSHVDSVIVGDGEEPFRLLCNMLASGKINNDVCGLHFKQYGVKDGDQRFFIESDLDRLPIPDRRLLPLENYTSIFSASRYITTMMTSRGCPYRCVYCKLNFQKPLMRSADSVIAEFKQIYELGIKEVELYDDTFTLSKARVLDICRGLIAQKIKISWAVRDRVNMVDETLLDQMKKAGCLRINYGIESGDDRILALMQKNITTFQARNAIKLAKKKKFTVLSYFMLGNKGETRADIERTIDFAFELNSDYAGFSITVPYPGTQIYLDALAEGVIKHDYWKFFALHPEPNFCIPQVYEQNLKLAELIELRNEAIRRYYLRPKFIIKEAFKLRTLGEFRRKAAMALRLCKSFSNNSYLKRK